MFTFRDMDLYYLSIVVCMGSFGVLYIDIYRWMEYISIAAHIYIGH